MKKFDALEPVNLIAPNKRALFDSVDHFEPIINKFTDSTNRLWCVSKKGGVQSESVLKLCHQGGVKGSYFWCGMQSLFGLDYPAQMGRYSEVYALLNSISEVPVPKLLACDSASEQYAGFIYTTVLPGRDVQGQVADKLVQQLAAHLSKLHQQQKSQFGPLFEPLFSADQWWPSVQNTIAELAECKDFEFDSKPLFDGVIAPQSFVPIMPDLRWDQFLQDSEKLTGLVDLDAFVFGTVELEFVVLEYLLDEKQAEQFKTVYQTTNTLPDLSGCREVYRVLLYLMNILGEKSFDAWIQAPTRF